MRHLLHVVALGAMLAAAGCHHEKSAVRTPLQAKQETPAAPEAAAPRAPAGKTCRSDSECADKQLCIRGQCVNITPELAECSMVRVRFDYDSADIHQGDLGALQRVSRCLKADRDLYVRIEGNADERGTEEYNLALGDRRATSVARYLASLGVSEAQLRTISYGKDKPLCVEHDEACWAKNRRAAVRPQEAKGQK
ncbi:MAG TPA: OmpA family protein [Polyangia bacterium]|jgi:peptidoglycan-associated lipoprotein